MPRAPAPTLWPIASATPPPAIIQQQRVELTRCYCRECLTLDRRHPDEGHQLTWPGFGRLW